MPVDTSDALRLQVNVRVEPAALFVEYALTNAGAAELGVFNRLPSLAIDGTTTLPPEAVYVDPEGTVLHLRKQALPLPEGLQMAARIVPGVTFLGSGATLVERFRLSIPVAANNPYRRAQLVHAARGAPVTPRRRLEASMLKLSLGAFQRDPAEKAIELSPAFPGVFRLWPPGPSVDRQVVISATAPLTPPVAVLDYEAEPRSTRP